MNPNVTRFLERSREALRAARHDLSGGFETAAVSRAYYAAFYAAQAALLAEGITATKTHSGTHDRFRQVFVTSGRIPVGEAKVLAEAFRLRQLADYDPDATVGVDLTRSLIGRVERFVDLIEEQVRGASAP